ncbi:integrase core domain-containing protein [Streptomyces mirabilis]|uniref:integrase core domain-containing protein n=1 Tax=Streptomyces mirabilis TaxID=68239 RepID=UPI0036B0657E
MGCSAPVLCARRPPVPLGTGPEEADREQRKRTCSRLAAENPFLGNTGIHVVLTGVRMPRMNSLTERWVQTCRHELLDRTLIWNERHLSHALREFERHHHAHRPHRAMRQAAPLRAVPEAITDPERVTRLNIRRNDRIGGVIREYRHAA